MQDKKVIVLIRDGWGYRQECYLNAICEGDTKVADTLMEKYPNVLVAASGEAVGLSKGFQGNSEVGHLTIGGGRVLFQSMVRINKAIEDGSFFAIVEFKQAIDFAREKGGSLHLAGILQTEGVHGLKEHLFALLDLCKRQDFHNVLIHIITDGRDAPVKNSMIHLKDLYAKIHELGFGKVATINGRFFAMDRDKRWKRTQKAYNNMVNAEGERVFNDAMEYVKQCHDKEETDEFIVPGHADWYQGIKDGDSFIFWNYRTDRPRQLTQAIREADFEHFKRRDLDIVYVGMTNYYGGMNALSAFKDQPVKNFLGEYISAHGMKQLRISETEKYAHVTFFFNGQIEEPYPGEERVLIPSPKVETYDLKPEMSVYEITDALLEKIEETDYQVVVVNLVNGDMVGHTGVIEAIQQAVHHVDLCVRKIVDKGLEKGYDLIVFADHGNAEDQTPEWRTSHTTNPVPCILVSNNPELQQVKLSEGRTLQDIAPTVLKLLGLPKPVEMTGESLY